MSNAQRRKGACGELEVCKILSEKLGVDAHRNLSQTRDGGTDIAVGKFRIECKRRKNIGNVYDWMKQSQDACDSSSQIPVVAFRADGKKWLVTLGMDDFCRLVGNELDD